MADRRIPKGILLPTADQTFQIEGEGLFHFAGVLRRTTEWQRAGEVARACEERYRAVQALIDLLPEEEEVALDWNHANSRAALEVLHLSAIDHFLIDEFELSAALLEQLLDLDPEDHLEASLLLAYNYVELSEEELFVDILPDVPEGASRALLELWAHFSTHHLLAPSLLEPLRKRYAATFEEFIAEEHPADEAYLKDVESEHPSARALARELWLRTENLWRLHPEFIMALRAIKG